MFSKVQFLMYRYLTYFIEVKFNQNVLKLIFFFSINYCTKIWKVSFLLFDFEIISKNILYVKINYERLTRLLMLKCLGVT